MSKVYTVKIIVPSGSRPLPFLKWLGKLLKDHRMEVTEVCDEDGTGYAIEKSDE